MSQRLRFARSETGEPCVVGSAYTTRPNLPVRRIPLPGGQLGIPASDLLDYHTLSLSAEDATRAAKTLHRTRCALPRKALAAPGILRGAADQDR